MRKEPSSKLVATSFGGVVAKGRGYATPLTGETQLQEIIRQTLGMEIVPGTLNVRLPKRSNGTLDQYVRGSFPENFRDLIPSWVRWIDDSFV